MLDTFIKQLAKDLEIDNLEPESPGIYPLNLEDDITILIKEIPQGISLTSVVVPVPKERLEPYFIDILHANLFGQSTRGAVLGLTEDGNQLTLFQAIDYNVNYREFSDILEDFINVVDFWRNETLNFK